ncbi:hypothetical protein BUALT_Bualt16G0004500 [Buddleja alternifolia]|uniref:Alpha/beta hydrolase fold-3 domain-containing protein n=1 Tax=Buddleja alternifolia TaxID=168488 RepID=A0AAV6W5P1_9LAMI|nr:hypothetical protein BUALT_Bualt16G0004500 [Buddleja alternifolia]
MYPAAFEDGLKVRQWLSKQAKLAECGKSLGSSKGGGADLRKSEGNWRVADAFGASLVEPWLAAHGGPSRCVLLGVSSGGNIVDYGARKAVDACNLLDLVKMVSQRNMNGREIAIAYLEEEHKVNGDAQVLEYKDAVHEFAPLDMLLETPQAHACAEDIAIWVKKYISIRGEEFSF